MPSALLTHSLPPSIITERTRIAAQESTKWAAQLPRSPVVARNTVPVASPATPFAPVSGNTWVSLGPTDAVSEYNGVSYAQVDSGRATGIAVDPRDANVVYLATAGGGVWKAWDFVASTPNPTWHPITENLGNLAVGAMALDPTNPDTLYIGLGDAESSGAYGFGAIYGNAIVKSTDGGGSWLAPVALSGTYPPTWGGLAVTPLAIRDLKVDPSNASIVLAATDVGLFRSPNGGASFSLVPLPSGVGAQVAVGAWSIAFVGSATGQSTWIVAGVYACGPGWLPPWPNFGVFTGQTSDMKPGGAVCTLGNLGDLWRSADSGNTWTSLSTVVGAFPAIPTGDLGRISVASGNTSNPSSTTLYAMLSNADESQGKTQAIWRSANGGATWADATGTLANRTNLYASSRRDCGDMNIAHGQASYNLAVAVDPTNSNNAIVGGNLCAVRTTSGLSSTPTWENVAHWLPAAGIGNVTGGSLPYVHADWHVALVSNIGGMLRTFAGTDGGIFSSTNLFTGGVTPPNVIWNFHNRGLVTHLCFTIGSGDPATGNPFVVLTGLQDNGVRYRDGPNDPTVFNQVLGGDGNGVAVNKGTVEYDWAKLNNQYYTCQPGSTACNTGGNWTHNDPVPAGSDSIPFLAYYSAVQTEPSGSTFLTFTNLAVWRINSSSTAWTSIVAFNGGNISSVFASQNIANLYGITSVQAQAAVTSNGSAWTISKPISSGSVNVTGFAGALSSIAFPITTPPLKTPGDVYLVSNAAWTMADNTLVPAAVGHLYKTEDRGTTWSPLHGNGSGQDLPNVPIQVVRFDPGDANNNTIYVGTDLGMYWSTDAGSTWQRFGYGLPMVRVSDMYIARNSSLIRIGTWGRGVWEVYPSSSAAKGVNGDGDFDRNSRIDWADLGAMGSRLGTTPATSGWPTYSWILDMTPGTITPPVDLIDEADLTALLGVFGGHP
jgi:hypothetical protein